MSPLLLTRVRGDLSRQGFRELPEEDGRLLFLRSRWTWDCLARVLMLICVRRVEVLDAQTIEADSTKLTEVAGRYRDPAFLAPVFGIRALLLIYFADRVEPAAARLCEGTPSWHWNRILVRAAAESSGNVYRLAASPPWFVSLFPKYSYVIQRLLTPELAPAREPVSVWGALAALVAIGLCTIIVLGALL